MVLFAGHVFRPAAGPVLPSECLGHGTDLPMAHGPLQSQQCGTPRWNSEWRLLLCTHAQQPPLPCYARAATAQGVLSTLRPG
jgi:hypothetical protein